MTVTVLEANLDRSAHQRDTLGLISAYAQDPMGQGKPLGEEVARKLIAELRKHPTTRIFLAYQDDQAVGIAVCFLGFSTFSAKPLMNIHDLSVLPTWRGQGIGQLLLEEVSRISHQLGCCKLTLEVVEGNRRALGVYEAFGFSQGTCGEGAGGTLFMTKDL